MQINREKPQSPDKVLAKIVAISSNTMKYNLTYI